LGLYGESDTTIEGFLTVSQDNKHTLMAKRVAREWLESKSRTEYKLIVYMNGEGSNINVASLMRTARNRKTEWSKMGPYPDLKVRAGFDFVTIRTHNKEAINEIGGFFREAGFETFGDFPDFESQGE